MPKVPRITNQTVATVTNMPIFVYGFLQLALMPPNAGPGKLITNQSPEAGTMLDIGGVVTGMVPTQQK